MQGHIFSRAEPVVLSTAAAATYVTLPATARYYVPFLARERSAAEVARELDVDIGSVTYRIRQMLDLGLVERTRLVPRAGRPIQRYRSTADSVFAPMHLTPIDTVRELFRRSRADADEGLEAGGERAWLRVGGMRRWGTHLYRPGPHSDVNRDFVPQGMVTGETFWGAVLAPSAPAVWDQHASLRLGREHAKRLQRELAELAGRYADMGDGEAADEYLVHLAMAPRHPGP
jgi:hypothetical protein